MKPIYLIGFMGSGKTTLGQALATATGLRLIDLDHLIEERHNASISQIFKNKGEEGFRLIERCILQQVSTSTDTIVACGGGTPCFFDNIDLMNHTGLTVFLDASHNRLLDRLKEARAHRPLIAAMTDEQLSEYISSSLARRLPHYSKASATFCADRLDTAEMINQSVALFIDRFITHKTDL